MSVKSFDSDHWIGKMGASLSELATQVNPEAYHFSGTPDRGWGQFAPYSYEEYQRLAEESAKGDPYFKEVLDRSHINFDDEPVEVEALLREHPVISRALQGSEREQDFHVVRPGGWKTVELRTFVAHLTKLTFGVGGEYAAEVLHRFLTLGDAYKLQAYEITVFNGLKLDSRIDLAVGAFLAPYHEVVSSCGEFPSDSPRHVRAEGKYYHPSADVPEGSAALVRQLTWGPAIAPVDADELWLADASTLRCQLITEDVPAGELDRHEMSRRRFQDHDRFVDFLCIATGEPQEYRFWYFKVDRWMEGLDIDSGSSVISGRDWMRRKDSLSEADAEILLEMIRGWKGYQGDRGGRDRLDLATRRLAGLPSRAGRFDMEDRILDTAIALEAMYNLDAPEITYKLQTRAGYYLGTSRKKRLKIFGKVRDFYRARSALVHGSDRRQRRDDVEKALSDGRKLARETLLALLRDGRPPDWNCLVMSAGEGGHGLSTQSTDVQGDSA